MNVVQSSETKISPSLTHFNGFSLFVTCVESNSCTRALPTFTIWVLEYLFVIEYAVQGLLFENIL